MKTRYETDREKTRGCLNACEDWKAHTQNEDESSSTN